MTSTLRDYRLHSDATAMATYLNVARMKPASQYAPYRVNIQDPTQGLGTFSLEKLCGNTASSVDSNCTSAYNPFTVRQIEQGTQYLNAGDTFSSCSILANGGNIVYIQNQSNLIDAVTVSLGANVAVWTWSPGQSAWLLR